MFDRDRGGLGPACHTSSAGRATPSSDPARFVDPATGTIRVKFINEHPDPVYFNIELELTGNIG